jgi:hypothetical protein
VNDAIDAFYGFLEDTWLVFAVEVVKVVDLDKVKLSSVLWPGFDHGFALGQRPSSAADSDAPGQQLVDDMSADEPSCAGDEDALSVVVSIWKLP